MPSALIPSRSPLEGQYVVLEPQNAAIHASNLYHASHDSDAGLPIWAYLAYGPWLDASNFNSDGSAKTSLSEMMQQRTPSQRGVENLKQEP